MRILEGTVRRTPVLTVPEIDERLGANVYFKCEHLQRCGAFKFRGAFHALSRLGEDARRSGVLTYSSGNHASGLALAGQLLGVSVTIAMPNNTSPVKRALALSYGAELVDCLPEEREAVGARVAAERGLTIIPPYDHDDIIAGQGTAALELMEDVSDLDMLVTPVGGGGLLAGTALAAALGGEKRPRVFGAEPELGDDAARSFRTGERVTLETVPQTVADGLRTRYVGERNFAVLRAHVDDIVTVTEDAILDAVARLWVYGKQTVEPSSAVPLAALLSGKLDASGRRVGVVLSGGNCDLAQVGAWVAERSAGLRS
ncbi:MAG: pyridoxal-phosphate dependent enzyme [Candidatus Eisenbacteria bacterium]|uniref:Pyridoxal-phosphate dependent enzyme n=1 Tax=Eiseniibacteriota bacterium TaxID=2212470 RepID=A0A956SC30_UNCEI|nr:pyridoxal-phosphate dependent enzyme [Candidatus Eisenbacteria bacterium]MCB9463298.1 pyridoxal-phosphate dependent enzyme [Candidatus Eisenbacteria bacterium]